MPDPRPEPLAPNTHDAPPQPLEPDAHDELRMPFMEHLRELRTRIIRVLAALLIAVVGCFFFAEQLYGWLVQPLADILGHDKAIIFLNPVEPFLVYLKAAVLAGILVASPYALYQLWKFVAPGLYPREKRAVLPFVLFGTLFFIGGAVFCRYIILPIGLEALLGVAASTTSFKVEAQITMQEYFSVATRLMLAFGLIFEMPVVVLFLSWTRIINHRTLLRYWRFAVLGSFIVGALLTPPDVATQFLLAGPMLVLYALSIGIAYLFGARSSP